MHERLNAASFERRGAQSLPLDRSGLHDGMILMIFRCKIFLQTAVGLSIAIFHSKGFREYPPPYAG
jgi:hypothetical protein